MSSLPSFFSRPSVIHRRILLGAVVAAVAALPLSTVVLRQTPATAGAPREVAAAAETSAGGDRRPTDVSTVMGGMTVPWGMAWLPDGSALVGERNSHALYRVTQTGEKTAIGVVPGVGSPTGAGNLLGVAVSPAFARDRLVYVFHTSTGGNRIVRMTFDGRRLGRPQPVLSGILTGATNPWHNAGRIAFGPDGYLYATTGDVTAELPQDLDSLNGKILRMTPEGQPAPGNPFGTLVYSYGHRNVQGLAWDSAGRLWASEFGDKKADELNLITPGGNYGWPVCEGECAVPGMTDPTVTWPTDIASPGGIAIVDDVVYLAALRGERLWRVPLRGEKAGTPEAYYVKQYGRLRTVEKVPHANALWMTTTNCDDLGKQPAGSDKILRVELRRENARG